MTSIAAADDQLPKLALPVPLLLRWTCVAQETRKLARELSAAAALLLLAAEGAAAALGTPSRNECQRRKKSGGGQKERRGVFHFVFGFGRKLLSLGSSNASSPMRPWRPHCGSARAVRRIQFFCVPPVSIWRNSMPQLPAIAFAKAGDDAPIGDQAEQPQPLELPPPPPPPLRVETRGAKPGRIVSDETRSRMSRAKEGRVMPLGELYSVLLSFSFFLSVLL